MSKYFYTIYDTVEGETNDATFDNCELRRDVNRRVLEYPISSYELKIRKSHKTHKFHKSRTEPAKCIIS
ncbi:hypothetical protein E24_00319 [Faustovirus]|nr:hypothetical protein PRJ_Fausto_00301 [Faustovirus]AMN83239.1 hypothetical protein E24_00319 [Faustovirus]AMN84220.1 hypothetical protein D5a_00316 [Faustovirus]AMN85208.1 hypothetical protein E23_00318 [Faustovirus]QBR99209.1 hypothetical protein [Faustovirus mariensis]